MATSLRPPDVRERIGPWVTSCGRVPGRGCRVIVSLPRRAGSADIGGNLALKRALLAGEGIVVSGMRVKDWQTRAWRPAVGTRQNRPQTGLAS